MSNRLSILRRAAQAGFVAAALLALPAHAISTYTVTELGGQIASRVNEQGDAVGWGSVSGAVRAYLHTAQDGFVNLPLPAGTTQSIAHDVSDRDASNRVRVVGSAYASILDEPGDAVVWTYEVGVGLVDVSFQPIGDLGPIYQGGYSEALAVNNSGTIVGRAMHQSRFIISSTIQDASGLRLLADTVAGATGIPQDINESGQITGYSGPNAWRVTGTTFESLGVPAGANISYGYAINDNGAVSASVILPTGGAERVARYSDANGWEILGGIGGTNIGWGINNAGDVVGEGVVGTLGQLGLIYTDELGRLAYLDDFLDANQPAGWSVFAAYDINDRGQIAAQGFNVLTGAGGGVLLTPTAQPQTPPAAPSDLVLIEVTASGIRFGWTDNSDNELVFRIERQTAAGSGFTEIFNTTAPVYHDANVVNCETYQYRVRAFNDAGNSDYSNVLTAAGPCVTAPAAPSDLTALSQLGDVVLNWTDNSDNESAFEVERDAGAGFVTIDSSVTGNGYIDNGAELCTVYRYRVRAVNVAGVSDYSNVAEVGTNCAPTSDLEAPVVTINAPTAGEAITLRNVDVDATATDNVGVVRMTLYVDGKRICRARRNQASHLQCTWGTRKYLPGDYTLDVVAIDAEGNEGTASVTVTLVEVQAGGGKGGNRTTTQAAVDSAPESGGSGSLGWLFLPLLGGLALRRGRRRER